MPALAGTRHAILCMHDWAQCAGSRWELACVLGLMCRIPLGTAPANLVHTESSDSVNLANKVKNIAAMR